MPWIIEKKKNVPTIKNTKVDTKKTGTKKPKTQKTNTKKRTNN